LDMIYLQFSFYEKQMSQVLLWNFWHVICKE